jgi:glycosyltransferase involved in cell wall biosynthesis
VVEALAVGLPVIVSDEVGIHREVEAAGVGGVVAAGNVAGLANELGRWLADSQLRLSASARAGALVRERYNWPAIARRWAAHYEGLVGTGAVAAPNPTGAAAL